MKVHWNQESAEERFVMSQIAIRDYVEGLPPSEFQELREAVKEREAREELLNPLRSEIRQKLKGLADLVVPPTPPLSDDALSRESIYEGRS
jgi:hypothetical protein